MTMRNAAASKYGIATKSDSYIFAIERNAIPISLGPSSADRREREELQADGHELLIIPAWKGAIEPEQIEQFRNDSRWKKLRWLLYASFWFGWALALLLALVLTATHPQCVITAREWWKDTIIYEIWTLSYEDSDADGVGDLSGIRHQLDELKRLGVGALLLKPIIRVESSGIGTIGHTEMASQIGGIQDFGRLMEAAHGKGLRILMDFPLVVASQAHPWFHRSALASRPENSAFADFFHWRRGIPSGEYISAYEQSTLKYFHVRGRPDLPVLSWANQNVSRAIKTALTFWLRQGVDGFHFSSIDYLHRTPDGKVPDWEEIARILSTLRAHVDEEAGSRDSSKKIFLFTSHEHLSERTKRLLSTHGRMDAVVHTELRKLAPGNRVCAKQEEASLAECANEIVADLLLFHAQMGPSCWPIWSLGGPQTGRLASRVRGRALAELLVLMELVLPGTPLVYFGEERGQRNSGKKCKYPQRGPLTWDDDFDEMLFLNSTTTNGTVPNSGFDLKPHQQRQLARNFRRLARLRQHSKTLADGHTYITKPMGRQAFAICRYLTQNDDGEENQEIHGDALIFAANFGPTPLTLSLVDLPPFHRRGRFQKGKVLARGMNGLGLRVNSMLDLAGRELRLEPVQGVVLLTKPGF